MKSRTLAALAVSFSLLAFCGFEFLHWDGVVHATRLNGEGCTCHGFDPSPSVQVIISGPDSLGVGQSAFYELFVIRDTNVAAGFNVASFLGSLAVGDSIEQQVVESELTHMSPKLSLNSDTVSWVFRYEAPEVPFYDTLYAAGNSVDTALDTDGDHWNFSDNFIIRVGNPTVVGGGRQSVKTFRLYQNFPNPFNPATAIGYDLPWASRVTISVFDVAGKEVARLVEGVQGSGYHEVVLDGGSLSSGIYLYRVTAGESSQTGKMVLAR